MAADPPWWRRLATVRARTTAAATLVVGLALAVAAVGLVLGLRRSLTGNVEEVAELLAADLAALSAQGELPARLAEPGDDGAVAQVVGAGGRVRAASAGIEADRPFADFAPEVSAPTARTVDELPVGEGDDGPYRVVAVGGRDATGEPVTVYVARSLEPVDETIALLRGALLVGAPVLLAFVGLTTWVVVGRALHPIDTIRAEVADISERSLGRRVPVPSARDEVRRLAETMNAMLARLDAAAERQRRFVADASHELQTPLASSRTELEVALAHPEQTETEATLRDLLAANRRMEDLVRNLLFLAREEGTPAPPPSLVDLDDVVLAESTRLRSGARVEVDTSRVSAAAVHGNPGDLARVVRNLLDNADRHATSAVRVELSSEDGEVRLMVTDDGPGIAAGDRDRVFDRFTRLDDARTADGGGAGLGLAIAKEIVARHGGTIAVEDSPVGARVVVRLVPA
jgi:signal transduction histidine kinase